MNHYGLDVYVRNSYFCENYTLCIEASQHSNTLNVARSSKRPILSLPLRFTPCHTPILIAAASGNA